MIEIILDAVKLLISKDSRDTATSIINMVRESPEWKNNLNTLDVKIAKNDSEVKYLIRDLAIEKIIDLKYKDDSINDFDFIFQELTSNAFQYGCSAYGTITIRITFSKSYISLIILNSKGIKINLSNVIATQKIKMERNKNSERGRGLLVVNHIADDISETKDSTGVKVIIYYNKVRFFKFKHDDLLVLNVISGLDNPSCKKRIIEKIMPSKESIVILNMVSLWNLLRTKRDSTLTGLSAIEEYNKHTKINKKFLIVSNNRDNFGELKIIPEETYFGSLESALNEINMSCIENSIYTEFKQSDVYVLLQGSMLD